MDELHALLMKFALRTWSSVNIKEDTLQCIQSQRAKVICRASVLNIIVAWMNRESRLHNHAFSRHSLSVSDTRGVDYQIAVTTPRYSVNVVGQYRHACTQTGVIPAAQCLPADCSNYTQLAWPDLTQRVADGEDLGCFLLTCRRAMSMSVMTEISDNTPVNSAEAKRWLL